MAMILPDSDEEILKWRARADKKNYHLLKSRQVMDATHVYPIIKKTY
jgi:hypothetical protein